jgi:serine/threonine protein kinase
LCSYASSSQLIEKSDVYSFGVVLLEIITGRSPILEGSQMDEHLTQFVQKRLSKGKIECVLNPKIEGQYNLNSIWKVAELALRCTDEPAKRPDMTAVVAELKESLDLEISNTEKGNMTSAVISDSADHPSNDNSTVGGVSITDYGPSAR